MMANDTEDILEEISFLILGLRLVRKKLDRELDHVKSDPSGALPGHCEYLASSIVSVESLIRKQENRRKQLNG